LPIVAKAAFRIRNHDSSQQDVPARGCSCPRGGGGLLDLDWQTQEGGAQKDRSPGPAPAPKGEWGKEEPKKEEWKKEEPCKKEEWKKEEPCKKEEWKKEEPCKKEKWKKEEPCKKEEWKKEEKKVNLKTNYIGDGSDAFMEIDLVAWPTENLSNNLMQL
jgi:hypothetical protein